VVIYAWVVLIGWHPSRQLNPDALAKLVGYPAS
jgi:hypothetical protein